MRSKAGKALAAHMASPFDETKSKPKHKQESTKKAEAMEAPDFSGGGKAKKEKRPKKRKALPSPFDTGEKSKKTKPKGEATKTKLPDVEM